VRDHLLLVLVRDHLLVVKYFQVVLEKLPTCQPEWSVVKMFSSSTPSQCHGGLDSSSESERSSKTQSRHHCHDPAKLRELHNRGILPNSGPVAVLLVHHVDSVSEPAAPGGARLSPAGCLPGLRPVPGPAKAPGAWSRRLGLPGTARPRPDSAPTRCPATEVVLGGIGETGPKRPSLRPRKTGGQRRRRI
jgi:hypothetical protein